ncbi:site-specific integrase, partial [Thioclava sp. BHET1]
PALYARLPDTVSGDCLRMLILTVVRMAACRQATTSEFDGDLWTIPAERVKGTDKRAIDFRVPLSQEAQRLAAKCKEFGGELMFPGITDRPISDAAVEKALRQLGEKGRPHGFRTAFRTWVQDTDACGYEVAETALGHSIGNKV